MRCRGDLRRFADEPVAPPVDRADQALRGTIVADGLARRLHPARHRGVGDHAPVPDFLDQFVVRDQPVAVRDQQRQQVEDLRFDGPHAAARAKLGGREIQLELAESVDHQPRIGQVITDSQRSPEFLQESCKLAGPGGVTLWP